MRFNSLTASAISSRLPKRRTPLTVMAVFSPVLWPSMASARRPRSSKIDCRPMLAANTSSAATSMSYSFWSSSFSVAASSAVGGGLRIGAREAEPRLRAASSMKSNQSRTCGKFMHRSPSILGYCEPSPGNRKQTRPGAVPWP